MDTTPTDVRRVAVVSRLHLVVQAIAAAVEDLGEPTLPLYWDGGEVSELVAPSRVDAAILVDDLEGSAEVRQARELVGAAEVPVLVLTAHAPGAVWGSIVSRRHAAVLSARTSLEEVLLLVQRMRQGDEVLPESRRRELVREWVDWVSQATDFQARLEQLSPRERAVLDLLAQGQRVSEVAEQLGVADGTVRSQVKSLRRKLGVDSQLAAVAAMNLYSGDVSALEASPVPPRPRQSSESKE
ncbi:MAG: LuxR C-terminal-related transcriptional regulator [Nocardioides sp.]|uniref:helix-turn-helix transcriptional regulator n=1 Tax=Nocardioides sp. TaxID=35761 RepID=UPI003F088FBF